MNTAANLLMFGGFFLIFVLDVRVPTNRVTRKLFNSKVKKNVSEVFLTLAAIVFVFVFFKTLWVIALALVIMVVGLVLDHLIEKSLKKANPNLDIWK